MSKIGTLATGAGTETVINLQFLPEFIVVGDIQTDVLEAMSWNVAGKELVNIQGAQPIGAYTKYKQNAILSTDDSSIARICTTGEGYLANQQFQLRLTNAGVTTPDIFAFSRRKGNGRVLTAAQVVVLDGANQRFQNFLELAFLGTNVSRVDITFKNAQSGQVFTDSYSVTELAALLALDNPTENGLLSGLLVIDNTNLLNKIGMTVESCTVYTSGANVNVLVGGVAAL